MPTRFGPASSFSSVAPHYDATRHIPAASLRACYDRLVAAGLFPERGRICDAGCGTGQISLPLAERGYAVAGYDIASEMVSLAQAKCQPGWDARYAVADVRALPEASAVFDAVVVSKLFMHIADWQLACRELIRVARPGAPLVHIRDRAAYGNAVRRHFTDRIRAAGIDTLFLGPDPGSSAELVAFMAAQGWTRIQVAMSDIGWRFETSAGDTLRGLRERIFAEFWYVPDAVYADALADTEAWAAAEPGGLDRTETMTPYLAVEVFRAEG
ncbi:class I SAM-dependent methyltransferase [Methylobacterium pseudosasicola]|uniref:Methyltransferase domain-containing protein n=1 Tax=Methylobacterium pseudosasicola TaxID=582667 RepID=A0A1I4RQL1_9HYPH|nr:class I SAM-dependent methyltransferase [Methylobacterium pseudosasicola]SFM54439.1 Methyltransferase domain-containing protein [Methylobacterium pseudosasicola]